MDIYIELGVHLRGPQDHHIQTVHRGAFPVGRSILHGGDLAVVRVVPDGFHGLQIKALDIQQLAEAACLQHIHHIAGDAAQAEGALDLLPQHDILQIFGRGQGCAAGAGLEGKAVLQQAAGLNDPGRRLRHHQTHRVPGDAGGAGNDAAGIADGLHGDHIIHIGLVDGALRQRIGHQIVRDDDHLFGIHGVREGIAQAAAGRSAQLAGAVAHGIRRGGGDKGHINGRLAGNDIGRAAAVGAELHRCGQHAVGNGPAHARRHIIALQVSDHAVFDVVHQRRMAVKQRAGVHIQIPDAGVGQRVQNHI